MNALYPLLHALRGSAERGIAHFRPPGAPRSGGAGLKAQVRLRLRPHSTTHAPHRSSPRPSQDAALQSLLRCVIDHAITPVFRGLRTQPMYADSAAKARHIVNQAKSSSYKRPQPMNSLVRQSARPKTHGKHLSPSPLDEPGLQYARRSQFSGFGLFPGTSMAPLGMRAAVDELEDRLRSYRHDSKDTTRRVTTRRHSTRRSGSSIHKAHQMKLARAIAGTTAAANVVKKCVTASEELELRFPSCSRPAPVDVLEGNMDDIEITFPPAPAPWIVTTLRVPLDPDLTLILATTLPYEPGQIPDSLCDALDDVRGAYHDYWLRVIVPLERGLEEGHLRSLAPTWEAGGVFQLFTDSGPVGPRHWPISFVNCTREDVLASLKLDVTPAVFSWLADLLYEDRLQPAFGDGGYVDTCEDYDEYDILHPPPSPSEDGYHHVSSDLDRLGPASLASMEQHGQGVPRGSEALCFPSQSSWVQQ